MTPLQTSLANQSTTLLADHAQNPMFPNSSASKEYWATYPNSFLLHRSLHERPLVPISASKHMIYLQNGQSILDACGGAAVANIGYGNSEVLDAISAQASCVSYIHTMLYTTPVAEELANLIVKDSPGGLSKAYFVGSGSEAMDSAMKLARQYFFEQGEVQRTHFIARRQSYHGNTIGSMSLSSNLGRLVPYKPIRLPNVSLVSPCYPYQYQREEESETDYVERLAHELEAEFQRVGPANVIAFVLEPIVGATSGCNTDVPGYLTAMKTICQKYGALLIMDEVMCGMGRSGTMFAWEHEGVAGDIVTIGKGLSGGYANIAGILIASHIIDVLDAGTGSFNHGHTYQAHPPSCAAALAVQKIVQREKLVSRCKEMGEELHRMLQEALGEEKYIGDIRRRGLFYAIEFVRDRKIKESFDPGAKVGPRVQMRALDLGVAIYPGTGTVDGVVGDHVLLAPPFTITIEEIKHIVRTLATAYRDVMEDLVQEGFL